MKWLERAYIVLCLLALAGILTLVVFWRTGA